MGGNKNRHEHHTPTKARPPSPVSSSSGSDRSSSVDSSSESSAAPIVENDDLLEWQLSGGKKGHLHLVNADDPNKTMCGRRLHNPEIGKGIEAARKTGRSWSPRCLAHLSPSIYERWLDVSKDP